MISGGDNTSLLTHFITKNREVREQVIKEEKKKILYILQGVKNLRHHSHDKDVPQILSIIAPVLSKKELEDNGVKCSARSFANARKHANIQGPGNPTPVITKKPIDQTTKEKIRNFLDRDDISRGIPV